VTGDSSRPPLIRVLLVDDQELVRAGLRGILRERFGFDVVGECADGSGVAAAVTASGPDVVLMDVRMPVVDGVTATRQLTAAGATPAAGAAPGDAAGGTRVPPVLALTTFDDDEALAGMLRAGAAGFILKGVSAEELQRAVRIVAEGGAWLDPAVTGRVLAAYREGPARQASRPAALGLLTAREREVLALIGAGRTNAEIARELFVGEGTVKSHVNHVFAKLSLRDRAAAVIFALDHGLTAPGGADTPG
jgi:DNA-binding NarL/FixJ family response regulator